jgi:hypothetical protein
MAGSSGSSRSRVSSGYRLVGGDASLERPYALGLSLSSLWTALSVARAARRFSTADAMKLTQWVAARPSASLARTLKV